MAHSAGAASDDQAVHDRIEAFEAAWNRHDPAAMAAFLTDDAEWVNVVGWWWRGKSSVHQGWEWIHRGLFKNTDWHADSAEEPGDNRPYGRTAS